MDVGLAQGGNHPIASPLGRPDIHKKHLVFPMIDDRIQFRAATYEIGRRQLALENGELKVIAVAAHFFEYASQPFVVGNIVANQIARTHTILHIGRTSSFIHQLYHWLEESVEVPIE